MIRHCCFTVVLALLSLSSCLAVENDAPKRPNILFIFVDDLGWGDLGLNFQNTKKGKKHQTPELDRMAQEGVRMLRHYCPAPVCAPSRSSLLSGLHQGHANVRDNQFDKALADNHTLATVLKAANYRNVLVGKYGLQGILKESPKDPMAWPAYPTKRGFDEFFGYVRHRDGHQHYPANDWPIGNSEGHRSPQELWHNNEEISDQLDKCYTTDLFTAFAKQWISKHHETSPDQPFFMYLAHDTPHAALQTATGPYPNGKGSKGGLQWLGKPGQMINTANGEIDSYIHPDYRDQSWSDVEQRFASMVRRIDNAVGDILQLLRDLDIAENTLVVFTSDNGPHSESYIAKRDYRPTSFQSYGPMDGMKRDAWEGGIRVPTLAWWPSAFPAGREDRNPSQFHDWLATFASAAGVPVPALSDGVSLLPQLTGKGTPQDSTVYVEYKNGGRTPDYKDYARERRKRKRGQMQVLFLDGYKGVRANIQDPSQDFEIYEVNSDPGERNNLAGTSASFTALNAKMKERVLQIRRTNRSAPRPYDNLPIPAVSETAIVPGLTWKIHEGEFPWVPNLTSEKADSTRSASKIGTELPIKATSVAHAYLKVPTAGEYTFHLSTQGKAVIKLHDALLIDADYSYASKDERHTTLRLEAGLHPLTIWVTAGEARPKLSLEWAVDGTRSTIPETALFQLGTK